jgi:hypothetical protein
MMLGLLTRVLKTSSAYSSGSSNFLRGSFSVANCRYGCLAGNKILGVDIRLCLIQELQRSVLTMDCMAVGTG